MVDFNSLPEAIQSLQNDMQMIKRLMENLEQPDVIFNVDETAAFLNVTRQTVYDMVGDGRIPNIKKKGSKRLFFSKRDLTTWLKESSRKVKEEAI
jgi:excisionase family DNA binding protein